jgi:hypothetical protein
VLLANSTASSSSLKEVTETMGPNISTCAAYAVDASPGATRTIVGAIKHPASAAPASSTSDSALIAPRCASKRSLASGDTTGFTTVPGSSASPTGNPRAAATNRSVKRSATDS